MKVTVTEKSYSEYTEEDIAATLRATSASIGGGVRGTCHLLYTDTVGALCARDYKGVGSQYVEEGKLIIEWHGH